jgi:16S rRNA (guanine(966)-N(2))-methyltransferase RsmD
VRVIAGTLKGRRLKSPAWDGLRPTSDRLRETLFNVLAPRLEGARVLDGYAGTGAVGIEALSRGARSVTFVERDRRARVLIAENLAHCGIESGCAIIRASFDRPEAPDVKPDAQHATSDVTRYSATPYNVVLLDPPYDAHPEQVIASAAGLLAPGGLLVLEHAKRTAAPASAAGLARTRQIVSGDSVLSFYSCPP